MEGRLLFLRLPCVEVYGLIVSKGIPAEEKRIKGRNLPKRKGGGSGGRKKKKRRRGALGGGSELLYVSRTAQEKESKDKVGEKKRDA